MSGSAIASNEPLGRIPEEISRRFESIGRLVGLAHQPCGGDRFFLTEQRPRWAGLGIPKP